MKYINAPFKWYIITLDIGDRINYQLSFSGFKIELKQSKSFEYVIKCLYSLFIINHGKNSSGNLSLDPDSRFSIVYFYHKNSA